MRKNDPLDLSWPWFIVFLTCFMVTGFAIVGAILYIGSLLHACAA